MSTWQPEEWNIETSESVAPADQEKKNIIHITFKVKPPYCELTVTDKELFSIDMKNQKNMIPFEPRAAYKICAYLWITPHHI